MKKSELLEAALAVRPFLAPEGDAPFAKLLTLMQLLYKEARPPVFEPNDRMRWPVKRMTKGDSFRFPIERIASARQAVYNCMEKTGKKFTVQKLNAKTGIIQCHFDPNPKASGSGVSTSLQEIFDDE